MLRWTSLRLLVALLISTEAAASRPQVGWVTLSNCQLRPNPANDGDSFHVVCNGREYIFRLYFVDAPETDDSVSKRVEEQARYFSISKQNALSVGETARQFAATRLSGTFDVLTRWEDAKGRSALPRYYAFVRFNGRDLGEALVENGLARVYGARAQLPDGTTATNERAKLRSLERQAKAARRGAWARSTNTRTAQQTPPSTEPRQSSAVATVGTNATQTAQFRISADGIRHNSSCRYFNGMTTRPCGPNDGRPCKICGG